jgi:hypothetical protein
MEQNLVLQVLLNRVGGVAWTNYFCIAVVVASTWLSKLPTANGQSTTTLMELWSIENPITTFNENTDTFAMDYGIHADIVVSDNLRVEILARNCAHPRLGTTEGILLESINGHGDHVFTIDPQIMSQNENVFGYNTDDEGHRWGEVELCLRYMLWTGPTSDPYALEVNFLETLLTLYIDLTKGFSITDFAIEFERDGRNNIILRDDYDVFAYLCDPITQEVVNTTVVRQGQIVTVCVEVEERAIQEGIYLEGVQEFSWIREYDDEFNLTQVVIENGAPSPDGLTDYACVPGMIICDFQSILKAIYFMAPGDVYGVGWATLTFTTLDDEDNTPTRRAQSLQQQEQATERSLQLQQAAPEGTSGFGLSLDVVPSQERGQIATSGAVFTNPKAIIDSMLLWFASSLLIITS